jgi:hypothetical protein
MRGEAIHHLAFSRGDGGWMDGRRAMCALLYLG